MKRLVLALVAVCLIGVCMAEPKPVDGGWHRSDEVPVETPVETPADVLLENPTDAPIPIEPASPWFVWGAVGVVGLIGLALLGWWMYRGRNDGA